MRYLWLSLWYRASKEALGYYLTDGSCQGKLKSTCTYSSDSGFTAFLYSELKTALKVAACRAWTGLIGFDQKCLEPIGSSGTEGDTSR